LWFFTEVYLKCPDSGHQANFSQLGYALGSQKKIRRIALLIMQTLTLDVFTDYI